jgi:tetratricopeptide (TPR) repeat protein
VAGVRSHPTGAMSPRTTQDLIVAQGPDMIPVRAVSFSSKAGCQVTQYVTLREVMRGFPSQAAVRLVSSVCAIAIGLAVGQGCTGHQKAAHDAQTSAQARALPQPQAMSLLGTPLYAPELPESVQRRRETELLAAQADYDRDPHDEDAAIWLGRRLAYLGRYREAIDVYTNALAIHPDSTRLLRHRGHRYITVRLFNLALDDLERAAALMASEPDDWEPDGQPNALNRPTSTNHSNVLYHLGLAHYLTGDFAQAAAAWRQCADFSRTDDMRVAADYWLYLSLRRLSQDADAAAVLSSIDANMEIIENHSYHQLLLMFKGDIDVSELTQTDAASGGATLGDMTIDEATVGYGIGIWREFNGDHEAALAQWREVINHTNWAAFGHIAAESELAQKPG